MRRLLLVIFSLCIFISLEGQLIKRANAFARAQVSGEVVIPDSVESGYYTHFWVQYGDGSATYMTDDGSVLTAWLDQSGDDNDLVNASGTDRPAKDVANTEIDFDDTDDYLADATFAYAQPITLYAVIRINTASNLDDLIRIASGTTGKIQIPDATNRTLRIVGGGSFFDTGNGAFTVGTYFILRAVWNNDVVGGSKLQVNAGSATTGTLATASADRIEFTTTTGAYPGVSCKEIIIRTLVDDATTQTAIVNYLNSKYSIY